jgi:hypothetical protein
VRGTKYRAYAQSSKAGLALTKIQPTTIAGVFALLKHVKEFNAGEVWLAETRGLPRPDQWHSGPLFWPRDEWS